MSRIIVKNLPSMITEKKLREVFEAKGFVTDLQLKYNKAGVFRKFAFIGYKTEEEAQAAKDYFNNTFIFTSKVQVENCANLNDPNKKKPWKEFLKQQTEPKEEENLKTKVKRKSKKGEDDDIPEELKNDSKFKEFLAVHENRLSKPLWADDFGDLEEKEEKHTKSTGDVDDDIHDDELKLEKSTLEDKKHDKKKKRKKKKKGPQNDITTKEAKIHNDLFTVKVRNLPYSCKRKQIKELFRPLKFASIRLPPKSKGFAYVSFKSEKDMNLALNKNKGFFGGHRIDVVKYQNKDNSTNQNQAQKFEENKEKDMEMLAETGRLYARNLCYTVTESEIQELFSKYGPLAEVHVPFDMLSKKTQGFAFITFMFAEHAIKAFSELDGTIFQGRLLHLIPAKPKKEIIFDENETNFKKKKDAKLKSLSGSSHNWNILFMGINAVADVIAEKYSVDKAQLLSGEGKESVAVRMALAETQVVMEARKFLLDNGVELDAFSQPAAERSKTVIVVKHLPAKTTAEELNELFSKHGTIGRIILPPSGLAALVEFQDPAEAKLAFRKLAYTRFKTLPLYLEWAPMNAVRDAPPKPLQSDASEDAEVHQKTSAKSIEEQGVDSKEEKEPPVGTTIFVRNISFGTTQESLKKHFEQCGSVFQATISTKLDVKKGKTLSMGFGFVQYKKVSSAKKALQNLQLSMLDGRALELKFSSRATVPTAESHKKRYDVKEQLSSKILVRNVPFGASEQEFKDLFKEFGTLKFIRLPKKMGNSNEHRGFGFVEYMTKSDAKRAFEALCHSTHLLGRRLVLEWANPESEDIDELRRKTARDFTDDGSKAKFKKSKLNEDVALAFARSNPEQ